MATEIRVPQLGESIVEATIDEWLKQEGDPVSIGDPLVSLETDKVSVEVGAEVAGVLASIKAQQGEDVKIGDVIGTIETNGQAPKEEAPKEEAPKDEAPKDEAPDEEAPEEEAEAEPPPESEPEAKEAAPEADGQTKKAQVTPVARRLAADKGVDPADVSGSGPDGKVRREDVEAHLARQEETEETPKRKPEAPPEKPAEQPQAPAAPAADRPEERVRMSRRRRTIARRLVEAQQTAAILTTFNEIDMGAVMEMRKRRQEAFVKQHDVKLGFTSFFVKAVIGACKDFPHLNAEIDGDEIVVKHYYDIGIAVGAEEGLVVPVIRNADRKSFAEIETEVKDYAGQVADGSLSLEALRGGTFTITNGGVFGSMLSTPILNPPQVGILGLHNIQERPVARDGEVVIRPMMYVALSYDHRIVDGREAVLFLVRVKELIEDPELMLLAG